MISKINNIQALRFFAAFSVVFVHLPLFGFGGWGVDIFFVISGFIISYVSEKNSDNFFTKRIIRIVPLYWMLTLGVFIIAIYKPGLLNNTTSNIEHLIKSLFFIPFNKNEIGHYPILFLGWTLNYEMFFYFLFYVSLKISKKYKEHICSFSLILIFIISNIFQNQNFLFRVYSSDIIFEFIFGMFIFKISKKIKNFNTLYFFLILFFTIIIFNFLDYNMPRIIKYGFPSALILLFFLKNLRENFFSQKIIFLGDASYCIYLIHPYVIQFFYKFLKVNESNILYNLLISIICIFIIFLLSTLIYLYYEKPLNYKLKNLLKLDKNVS